MHLKRLLSDGEYDTRKRIQSASKRHDADCFSLVRVADVIGDLDKLALSSEHVSYAFKAHFDFVICDMDTAALFVIEYDGSFHSTPEQTKRDLLKDEICRSIGLPFIRIDSRHLYRWNEDILKWLLDYWFYSKMLMEAQGMGSLPADELPDPFLIGSLDDSEQTFPMMLGLKYRVFLQRASKAGKIPIGTAFEWIGMSESKPGHYSAIALTKVDGGKWVIGSIRMMAFNFGFFTSDLISELVIMELYKMVKLYISDPNNSFATEETVNVLLEKAVDGYQMCQSGGTRDHLQGIRTSNPYLNILGRFYE